ncbi:hypothetical protein [Paenibacillus periandrae]|uniref:hypothetical protein n=1 Tax=Paenibacillus periandrae TaxID=1761741 RepID=UPI001F099CAD|nr:hypothetical protein [Paenibacillus periandrae]
MARTKDNEGLKLIAAKYFSDLQQTIDDMDEKRARSFLQWINNMNTNLRFETTFDQVKLRKYDRGEIVYVNF